MADAVGKMVRLRNGVIAGPVAPPHRFEHEYPYRLDENVELSWTRDGSFLDGSVKTQDVVQVLDVTPEQILEMSND
jgi:hypothetical protein